MDKLNLHYKLQMGKYIGCQDGSAESKFPRLPFPPKKTKTKMHYNFPHSSSCKKNRFVSIFLLNVIFFGQPCNDSTRKIIIKKYEKKQLLDNGHNRTIKGEIFLVRRPRRYTKRQLLALLRQVDSECAEEPHQTWLIALCKMHGPLSSLLVY